MSKILILFSSFFLIFACSKDVDRQQAIKKKEFFTRLLFFEGVAFAVHGSKPVSEVVLDRRTQKEKDLDSKEFISTLTDEDKRLIELQESAPWNPKYSFEETFDEWERTLDPEGLNNFLLVHVDRKIKNYDFVYFVNILETAKVLTIHYDLFKRFVEFDFDPLETSLHFGNVESVFWNKIFSDNTSPQRVCLWGILFGYGVENSLPFSWFFEEGKLGKKGQFIKTLERRCALQSTNLGFKKLSSKDFPVPGFISFSEPDNRLQKYELEKKRIKKIYKACNLEQVFMQGLYAN